MINTELRKQFKVGDKVWFLMNKERLQGKKIKALQYGRFEVLEKVDDNAYILILPPYMCIYSIVSWKIRNSMSLPCWIRKVRRRSYLP
jgi:hypothetical protein